MCIVVLLPLISLLKQPLNLQLQPKENTMIKVEYIEELQMWHAGYQDELGKLGDGFTAQKRDDAIFALGLSMGRRPERHSRPLGDYLDQPTK
jgi:hypothetical protein